MDKFKAHHYKDGNWLIVTWELPATSQPREMMPIPDIEEYRLVSLTQHAGEKSCKTIMKFEFLEELDSYNPKGGEK